MTREKFEREEMIGLSIMAYLDTHLKHDETTVCKGVTLKDAREWIRRKIEQDKLLVDMTEEKLNNVIDEYIKSKELVLMAYPPEYVDDVKQDILLAFRAGYSRGLLEGMTTKKDKGE